MSLIAEFSDFPVQLLSSFIPFLMTNNHVKAGTK